MLKTSFIFSLGALWASSATVLITGVDLPFLHVGMSVATGIIIGGLVHMVFEFFE